MNHDTLYGSRTEGSQRSELKAADGSVLTTEKKMEMIKQHFERLLSDPENDVATQRDRIAEIWQSIAMQPRGY